MHPPRDTGPVGYRVSQNNPGTSRAFALVALQHWSSVRNLMFFRFNVALGMNSEGLLNSQQTGVGRLV